MCGLGASVVGDPSLVLRDKDKFDLLLASVKFSF